MDNQSTGIGTINEKPLHAALKTWCARPGDLLEFKVDGYVIDIVREDTLIEIQTANFSGIKSKLKNLTTNHKLRLVYPLAVELWILKLPREGENKPTRRKSPKRGKITHLFRELVSFPELAQNPNFSLDIVLIQEEVVRRFAGKTHWRRRGWATQERRLLKVLDHRLFSKPMDYIELTPPGLPDRFTTADLASQLAIPRRLAQQMAYCLRKMKAIEKVGTRKRSNIYTIGDAFTDV